MGIETSIQWCTSSWNPWTGCRKIGPGCENCYAERDMKRYGKNFDEVTKSKTTFEDPLKWKEPRMIFTCSWSDFFISDAYRWRKAAWQIIKDTPQHTYQILTKRPYQMLDELPIGWPKGYEHVWLGVSVETISQIWRIGILEKVEATVHFISFEPLLGPMPVAIIHGLDWIIIGGESGPNARPMNLDWARAIRDACVEESIPFFFKQNGGIKKVDGAWGGRELDGEIWSQMPDDAKPK